MIWTLRFRHSIRGVTTGAIEAADITQAQAVGQAYCEGIPNTKYISVERFVLADASILSGQHVPQRPIEAVTGKPSQSEQRERLEQRSTGSKVSGVAEPSGALTGRVGA